VIDMIEQKPASLFVPVLLIALAVVVWSGFQASQLYQERASLSSLRTSQEATFSNAEKMRRQLDSLATGTQQLASAGNKNAQAVVNALQQRGITINPDAKKPQ
jgi:predicted negative regulator of RcsB-dependent stress response